MINLHKCMGPGGVKLMTPGSAIRLITIYTMGSGNIQSDISKASPKHYFRDVFRVQISSEEQPVCNILLL